MKKWSVTSVPTPATCNRRGARAQPGTQQGHCLLYAQVCVCVHLCRSRKEGSPALGRVTACPQTHCSSEKDPMEQERAATGLAGPMHCHCPCSSLEPTGLHLDTLEELIFLISVGLRINVPFLNFPTCAARPLDKMLGADFLDLLSS